MRLALISVAIWCLLSSLSGVGAVRRALAGLDTLDTIDTIDTIDNLDPKEYALALTNAYRALHDRTDPLTRGPFSIEREYTQAWADRLQYASVLEHSGYPGLGENIAFAYGNESDAGARGAIKEAYRMFYDEEVQDYYDNVTDAVTGHFTQIVWRSSQTMTFAYTHNPLTGRYAMVAHFLPPGNYIGQFAANVGLRKNTAKPPPPQPVAKPPPPRSMCELVILDAIRNAERCRSSGGSMLRLG